MMISSLFAIKDHRIKFTVGYNRGTSNVSISSISFKPLYLTPDILGREEQNQYVIQGETWPNGIVPYKFHEDIPSRSR